MFVKVTYTVEGISFDNYARAWDCLMARKYPDIMLFDSSGYIVHSCEIARAFIVNNQEEADFVEEYLLYKGEELYYDDDIPVEPDSLIIRDYHNQYGIYTRKQIKKKSSVPYHMLTNFYFSECDLCAFYKI